MVPAVSPPAVVTPDRVAPAGVAATLDGVAPTLDGVAPPETPDGVTPPVRVDPAGVAPPRAAPPEGVAPTAGETGTPIFPAAC